ncbi:hypothetical protein ACIBCM_34635, partial [Streptomyces sp. NPDC051018]|uniref:hypothetical protein n=1 Tax=Streptomyces sp. NPDC051018 TaxID=3365639 RepID=UPI0037A7FFFF
MPEFLPDALDYELPRESANVVNTPKGKGLSNQSPDRIRSPETECGKGLVRLETQDRREMPGGPG